MADIYRMYAFFLVTIDQVAISQKFNYNKSFFSLNFLHEITLYEYITRYLFILLLVNIDVIGKY